MKITAKKGAGKSTQTSISATKGATKPTVNPAKSAPNGSLGDEVQSALKWLKSHGTKATLEGMARYAIPSDKALGVAYKDVRPRNCQSLRGKQSVRAKKNPRGLVHPPEVLTQGSRTEPHQP